MTTKVVIPCPQGLNEIRIFSNGETYCGECNDAFDTDDWNSKDVYDSEELGDWIKRYNPAIETQDERSVYDLFGGEGIRVVTLTICPNGCEFYGGEGDSWWQISETQYVCDNCSDWYTEPHSALLCCHGHGNEDCYCIQMVQTKPNGQPELIDGLPISYCRCGGGECDQVVCLVCHICFDDTSLDTARGHALLHGDWELAPGNQVYGSQVTVSGSYINTGVTLYSNCLICGTYCCKVHKTHVPSHGMCWL
jgi:hypothetical protein